MAEINSLEELGSAMSDAAAAAPEGTEAAVAAPAPDAPVYERKVDELGRAYATGKSVPCLPPSCLSALDMPFLSTSDSNRCFFRFRRNARWQTFK